MISSSSLFPWYFQSYCLLFSVSSQAVSNSCDFWATHNSLPGVVRGLVYLVWKVSFTWASGRTQYYRKQLWYWSETLRHVIELHLHPGFIIKKSLLSPFLPIFLSSSAGSVSYFCENDQERLEIISPPHLVHEAQKVNRGKGLLAQE